VGSVRYENILQFPISIPPFGMEIVYEASAYVAKSAMFMQSQRDGAN
jgi:hypothetical protein